MAVFGLTARRFVTPDTFRTIASQILDAILLAVGMTFVLIGGGINLTVGAVLALSSGVLGPALVQWQFLLVGCACGPVNGLVTTR